MPSFSSLATACALMFLSSTLLTSAMPAAPSRGSSSNSRDDLTVPTTGGNTTLPSTDLSLFKVALGRGIQNYSCASVGATPVAIGAIATLYDATELAECDENNLNSVPAIVVDDEPPSSGTTYTLSPPYNTLPALGHHYFAADTTPTFNLTAVSMILYGSKNGDIAAPSSASKGPADTGAVDWLSLLAKVDYDPSIGLGQVYRVETAGGAAPATCPSTDVISVQYSAEYWFFSA